MPVSNRTELIDIIAAYWLVPVVAFAVSFLMTPVCRRLALSWSLVDKPDEELKTHKVPIPHTGGVAIWAGWLLGIIFSCVTIRNAGDPSESIGESPSMYLRIMVGLLAAGTCITILGLIDDIRGVSPRAKLLVNIIVALVVIWLGIGDDIVRVLSGSAGVRFAESETWLIWAYSVPLSVFIIVGACNATNLIDGLDGLCSGVLGIIAIGFLILAVHMHTYSDWGPRDVQRVVLSLALLGSCLGFLPFNRNPARIFMGDAGSMLLGLNAAVLLLMFGEEHRIKWMLGSVMVFGLPVTDMVLTLVRRWRAQRPIMIGDRSHFYDQLVDRGLSVRKVVRISYLSTAVFVALGVLPTIMRTRHIVLVYTVFIVLLMYVVHRYRMVRVDGDANARTGGNS